MKKVLLDTNFLLIPHQFKVDIFSEVRRICTFQYKLVIVDKTIDELKKIIEEQRGKNKLAAVLALDFIEKMKIEKIKTKKKLIVDDLIFNIVNKNIIVATQDAELKKRIKGKGISLIVLKNKAYLALIEG